MPAAQRKCIYEDLTLDVDRHYIGSITATTHQEKGIITLESNPSRGTVLPALHGKGNKCDKNVREKGRDLTQSYDKNPYTHRTIQNTTRQHKTLPKNLITHLLRADLGRSIGETAVIELVWLNRFTSGLQPSK